jgi:hypothetical protein
MNFYLLKIKLFMDSTFLPSEGEKSIGDHTNQTSAFETPKSSWDMQAPTPFEVG